MMCVRCHSLSCILVKRCSENIDGSVDVVDGNISALPLDQMKTIKSEYAKGLGKALTVSGTMFHSQF